MTPDVNELPPPAPEALTRWHLAYRRRRRLRTLARGIAPVGCFIGVLCALTDPLFGVGLAVSAVLGAELLTWRVWRCPRCGASLQAQRGLRREAKNLTVCPRCGFELW